MLVLTRKLQEEICVGNNVKITVLRISGNSVRIGIEAPRDVRILRGELELHFDDSQSGRAPFRRMTDGHARASECSVSRPDESTG